MHSRNIEDVDNKIKQLLKNKAEMVDDAEKQRTIYDELNAKWVMSSTSHKMFSYTVVFVMCLFMLYALFFITSIPMCLFMPQICYRIFPWFYHV